MHAVCNSVGKSSEFCGGPLIHSPCVWVIPHTHSPVGCALCGETMRTTKPIMLASCLALPKGRCWEYICFQPWVCIQVSVWSLFPECSALTPGWVGSGTASLVYVWLGEVLGDRQRRVLLLCSLLGPSCRVGPPQDPQKEGLTRPSSRDPHSHVCFPLLSAEALEGWILRSPPPGHRWCADLPH